MDSPRSSSALSSRSSRRSFPNLHHLSLAPLSSKYLLDASSPTSPSGDSTRAFRTSYIQGKSAPATPGILSLSQSHSPSRHGRSTARTYAYDGYFLPADAPSRDLGAIPKAKSSSALLAAPGRASDRERDAREQGPELAGAAGQLDEPGAVGRGLRRPGPRAPLCAAERRAFC